MPNRDRRALSVAPEPTEHPRQLLATTWRAFLRVQPFRCAAALSYYTLLSMAPLLLVLTGFGGFLVNEADIRREIVTQFNGLIGHDGAELMATILANAHQPQRGILSMTLGIALMLFGATTVFAELQTTLNELWGVEASPRDALSGFLRARLESFAMVLGTGFLLLVSLILTATMAVLQHGMPDYVAAWDALDALTSFGLVTLVLALLFKYVPDVRIAWRDTWFGAALTAMLFTVGKFGIGLYLGQASVGSAYGAAGSAVALMVWVYYAALIFFFGAVATKVIARIRGVPLQPSQHARIQDDSASRPRR
jgi:membrane protein